MKPNTIVFLISGSGGTFKSLNEYLKTHQLSHEFKLYVVCDRNSPALTYAKDEGIKHTQVAYNKDQSESLFKVLKQIDPDLIITNIFKILDRKIVGAFKGKLVNFHYSLLPAFKGYIGMKSIKAAVESGCRFVGSTCHHVEEDVDDGRIISQCVTESIKDMEEFNALQNVIFRSNILLAISLIHSEFEESTYSSEQNDTQLVQVMGKKVWFSPALHPSLKMPDEDFWKKIALL